MKKFYKIYNYLKECVNNGVYSTMYANEILDLACEKYLIERNSHNKLSPDEEKRRRKILKSLDYNPRTKTISDGRGGRVKVNFDRYHNNTDSHNVKYTTSRHEKNIDNYLNYFHPINTQYANDKNIELVRNQKNPDYSAVKTSKLPMIKDKDGKVRINHDKIEADKNKYMNAISHENLSNNDIKQRNLNRKTKDITLSDSINNTDVFAQHELGHKNATDKKRNYTKSTGLSHLRDDEQENVDGIDVTMRNKMPIKLRKKYINADSDEKRYLDIRTRRALADKGSTSYVKSENIARNYLDNQREGKIMNHDNNPEELTADAYAIRNSKHKRPDIALKKELMKGYKHEIDRHEYIPGFNKINTISINNKNNARNRGSKLTNNKSNDDAFK